MLAQDFTEFFKQQDNPYVYVPPCAEQALHVGLPTDYGLAYLNDQLAEFREKNTDVPIVVRCDLSDLLVESLVLGELDTAIAIVREGSENWLSETWEIDPVWAVASDFVLRDEEAVPLVVHPEGCEYRSRVVESLNAVGRNWYVVYQSPDISGLQEAVVQGLGISALTQPTLVSGMRVLESGIDLPHMRSINVGLYQTQNVRSEKAMLLDSWLREALGRREFPE
ncbi:MAG: LysR substrate-binding domain-containing protein [Gammaproteobacteria bacterium]|nr:LysR substrate-binding domain-containing protein [Gammaproteobacteria bacterium]